MVASSKKISKRTFHDGRMLVLEEDQLEENNDQVLERKTNNPELLARLFELERAIIKRAKSRIQKI